MKFNLRKELYEEICNKQNLVDKYNIYCIRFDIYDYKNLKRFFH